MITAPLTLADLPAAAQQLLAAFPDRRVFAFHGELGAGKTTFIKALCLALGVQDAMSSPSFAVVNTYDSPAGPVHHYDLYRLRSAAEAFDVGLEEDVWSGAYCFIEWPEKAAEVLPEDVVEVFIRVEGTLRVVEAR